MHALEALKPTSAHVTSSRGMVSKMVMLVSCLLDVEWIEVINLLLVREQEKGACQRWKYRGAGCRKLPERSPQRTCLHCRRTECCKTPPGREIRMYFGVRRQGRGPVSPYMLQRGGEEWVTRAHEKAVERVEEH